MSGKIIPTGIPIHHFEVLRGRYFISKKSNYYIKLLKNKVKLHPKAKFYFELALELKNAKDRSQAKKYFDKAIKLNPYYKRLV